MRTHFSNSFSFVAIIGLAVLAAAPARSAPFVEIVPVQPLGTNAAPYPMGTTIDGNTMTVPAGTRVWFDVYVSDWAPFVPDTFQGAIGEASLASGPGAPLIPAKGVV